MSQDLRLEGVPQKEKSLRSRKEVNVVEAHEVRAGEGRSRGKRRIKYGPVAAEGIWILFTRASTHYILFA